MQDSFVAGREMTEGIKFVFELMFEANNKLNTFITIMRTVSYAKQ